jgi:hypothetical protein
MKCPEEMPRPPLVMVPAGCTDQPVRQVAGIAIYEKPIPSRNGALESRWTRVILALRPGECFEVPTASVRGSVCRAATRMGIPVVTRKVDGGLWVWLKDQSPKQRG